MAIEFSCSSCEKNYRVKDALAGKTADCTACGTKMHIPELVSAASESGLNLNKLSGLIDDVLPTEASATLTQAVTTSCDKCGEPISLDAIICVACGFDKRLGDVRETDSEAKYEEGEKRTTTDRLKRGGAFSFLGAILGAAVWFALAAVIGIGVEVGYPAIVVGVLAGLGMGRFYGEDTNTMAGVIASAMALAGIFAAKALIFDHYGSAIAENSGATEEIVTETIQVHSMLSLFQWYDILFILLAVVIAFALSKNYESIEPEAV